MWFSNEWLKRSKLTNLFCMLFQIVDYLLHKRLDCFDALVIFFFKGKFVIHLWWWLSITEELVFLISSPDSFICFFSSFNKMKSNLLLLALSIFDHLHLFAVQENKITFCSFIPLSTFILFLNLGFGID